MSKGAVRGRSSKVPRDIEFRDYF
ncbi:hypothetical protein OOU_Y34scaffold00650g1 [Pyricularia oryzae Y34]|uniref:Uncharacterized protein n=2 Tax=Pyricularia oryzae TaxID=318829 RepID=A0AA97NUS6_PYRO3|nr:hypothetical protein OOU_Y34scaffold00650g1 [Pyricularia oryzae Y34]